MARFPLALGADSLRLALPTFESRRKEFYERQNDRSYDLVDGNGAFAHIGDGGSKDQAKSRNADCHDDAGMGHNKTVFL